VTCSVYYISVGSSTCFGCWHPSSGARTTVITAYSCLQKYNKLSKSHLVGQLLNSIHDARTHVHKKKKARNVLRVLW